MKRIHVFLQCCKSKNNITAPAKYVYCSNLFKQSLRYAKSLNPDSIHILSAKYGIINPDTVISPYNVTINDMTERERESLGQFRFSNEYRKIWICRMICLFSSVGRIIENILFDSSGITKYLWNIWGLVNKYNG